LALERLSAIGEKIHSQSMVRWFPQWSFRCQLESQQITSSRQPHIPHRSHDALEKGLKHFAERDAPASLPCFERANLEFPQYRDDHPEPAFSSLLNFTAQREPVTGLADPETNTESTGSKNRKYRRRGNRNDLRRSASAGNRRQPRWARAPREPAEAFKNGSQHRSSLLSPKCIFPDFWFSYLPPYLFTPLLRLLG
jgi:hypothetical protein